MVAIKTLLTSIAVLMFILLFVVLAKLIIPALIGIFTIAVIYLIYSSLAEEDDYYSL